jgi:hypothetical protein
LGQARAGNLDKRADAMMAHRIRIARIAHGKEEDDPTGIERAGAILEAERDADLHHLTEMYEQVHKPQ